MSDLKEFTKKMERTCAVLLENFNAVRAGRANAAVLDRITVIYFCTVAGPICISFAMARMVLPPYT